MVTKLILLFLILFQTSKCAFSQEPERTILQGTQAKLGQFPYVVYLKNTPIVPNPENKGAACTGAILSELWVVTGAHCYMKFDKLTDVTTQVKAGTIDTKKNTIHTQERRSDYHVMMEKNPHKKGRGYGLFNNDILILKVTKPFTLNANVGPITIAKRPLPEGKKLTCIVVGFGLTEAPTPPTKPPTPTKLYYTYALLDGDKFSCRKRAEKRNDSDVEDWGEENICMDPVDFRSTPCSGDSGGPLVCDGLDVGTSVGRVNIYNDVPFCGTFGNYHVYTYLGFYEEWLRKHIPELRPFKRVKANSPSKSTAASGVASGVADIGLVICIDFILSHILHTSFL